MSNSCFNLHSIFTFSAPGNAAAELTSSSAHLYVSLCTNSSRFHFTLFFSPLNHKTQRLFVVSLTETFGFFLKCGCSLWVRLTVYKINAAVAFQWYGRSFPHTGEEMSMRICTQLLLHDTLAAESMCDSRSDVRNTEGRTGFTPMFHAALRPRRLCKLLVFV